MWETIIDTQRSEVPIVEEDFDLSLVLNNGPDDPLVEPGIYWIQASVEVTVFYPWPHAPTAGRANGMVDATVIEITAEVS